MKRVFNKKTQMPFGAGSGERCQNQIKKMPQYMELGSPCQGLNGGQNEEDGKG
jgi:hypothetical protein